MNVDGVRTGIVLDHICAGKSMNVYKLLQLNKLNCSVAIIQNVVSTKYGKKDIIKIDEMIDLDVNILGYVDPNITINYVVDGKNMKKKRLALPLNIHNVIHCKNPRCITSIEQEINHQFKLIDKEKKIYCCVYCDVAHKD